MDPRLLEYYNRELNYLREVGGEFARAYPRIASRLGLDGFECADPYVERLLEGFAFLSARVQLKVDARYPVFTEHLLEMLYPQVLAPVPACGIVELAPDLQAAAVRGGLSIARGTSLRTVAQNDQTACEFRTTQAVQLWPLNVVEAKYMSGPAALQALGFEDPAARAVLRLRLKSMNTPLRSLPIDALTFFVKAAPNTAASLYEQLATGFTSMHVRPVPGGAARRLPEAQIAPLGFDADAALLPVTPKGFEGYRLIQEYFTLPERFMFIELRGLQEAFASCNEDQMELLIVLDRAQPRLDNAVDTRQLRLFCTPVVNLFSKTLDRVTVTPYTTEHHIVPDRARPLDFEIHHLASVTAIGSAGEKLAELTPAYTTNHRAQQTPRPSYTVQRRLRVQSQEGGSAMYAGTECFIALSDAGTRALTADVQQLDIRAVCSNRDLPLSVGFGEGRTDFILAGDAPVYAVKLIVGPTVPRASPASGDAGWRFLRHLSRSYLAFSNAESAARVESLRDLLELYANLADVGAARQIEGIRGLRFDPIFERLPLPGPLSYGRGHRVVLQLDDDAFEGSGLLLLGSVLERFFSHCSGINSFVQMSLQSVKRGEVKRWPVRFATRQSI
jgi:type VI secretion system protein ImpG